MVDSNSKEVGAVVLAAGASSRMGSPKQALKLQGKSLLRRAVLAALNAGCRPVVVVTGAHSELSRREFEGLDAREVFNTSWETGMASSIRAGIEGLVSMEADIAAVVLLLCDQPYVTEDVIYSLLAAHRNTGRPVIASAYGGSFGAPALFSRTIFAELMQQEGISGAKEIIRRHALEAHFLPFKEGEVDVDTPDDFSRLIAKDVEKESAPGKAP